MNIASPNQVYDLDLYQSRRERLQIHLCDVGQIFRSGLVAAFRIDKQVSSIPKLSLTAFTRELNTLLPSSLSDRHNGTTSVAPKRGCSPLCVFRSISSAALAVHDGSIDDDFRFGDKGYDTAVVIRVHLFVQNHAPLAERMASQSLQ